MHNEPNDSKAFENNTCIPSNTVILNILNLLYKNSQIAIQQIILLRKFFSCIALLLCKIFKRNRSLQ